MLTVRKLVKANRSLDEKNRLTDEELISQMRYASAVSTRTNTEIGINGHNVRTILLAGHETTATTMNWGLMELANNPAVQDRLRSEIYENE